MAASAHFFAAAGLEFPAAMNGPQYIADRGTSDPQFRAVGDVLRVPTAPGLGLELSGEIRRVMTTVVQSRDALPA